MPASARTCVALMLPAPITPTRVRTAPASPFASPRRTRRDHLAESYVHLVAVRVDARCRVDGRRRRKFKRASGELLVGGPHGILALQRRAETTIAVRRLATISLKWSDHGVWAPPVGGRWSSVHGGIVRFVRTHGRGRRRHNRHRP